MKLRKLELKDADLMLEWMHDANVVHDLSTDFASKTLEDCKRFIEDNQNFFIDYVNLAIVDDSDIYMGTVSLKHVMKDLGIAEFAITVRASAMGHGFSRYGMSEIIRIGMKDLRLKEIYWCVSKDNKRAVRFYDKNQYTRTENVPKHILSNYMPEQLENFLWYVVTAPLC